MMQWYGDVHPALDGERIPLCPVDFPDLRNGLAYPRALSCGENASAFMQYPSRATCDPYYQHRLQHSFRCDNPSVPRTFPFFDGSSELHPAGCIPELIARRMNCLAPSNHLFTSSAMHFSQHAGDCCSTFALIISFITLAFSVSESSKQHLKFRQSSCNGPTSGIRTSPSADHI